MRRPRRKWTGSILDNALSDFIKSQPAEDEFYFG